MQIFSTMVRYSPLILISLLATSHFALGGPSDDSAASKANPDIEYTLSLPDCGTPSIGVQITTRGAHDGNTTFAVAEEWGGVSSCGKDLTDVTVRGRNNRVLPFEHPKDHEWTVAHEPDEPLTFSYTLRQSPDRTPSDRVNDYRPIITNDLIHVIGNHGLAYPKHLSDENPRNIALHWKNFDKPGWNVASSFGPGSESRTVSKTLDEFRHGLFLAGEIRLHQKTLRGSRVGVSINGTQWHFSDDAFVDLVTRIIETERDFFNDFSDPWYLVSLIPAGPDDPQSLSLGGTGLTNCFALFVSLSATLERGSSGENQMKRLLAHEYFHRWNGGRLDFPEPEGALYWFSEGFTDFYARRLLLRSGLYTPAEYAADLNESIKNYHLSPVRNEPNERLIADFWKNPNVQTMPYRRGDLLALLIDHEISRSSNGKKSLDDLMRQLLAVERQPRTKIDMDQMMQLFAEYTSSGFAEKIRDYVTTGKTIELPENIGSPDYRLTKRNVYEYELGFDDEGTRREKKVVGVRSDSPAHKAGLRDGQKLAGWSMMHGNSDYEVKLTILDGDQRKEISFLPQGKPVEVPFVAPREAAETKSTP